jgi:glycosyltransferase involved in cell wall biosynthesis
MLISIIIPVYNEEKFIKEILVRIDKIKGMHKEVIIVNDKSNDDTLNIIQNQCHGIFTKLINNDKNMGKGFSVREGIKCATGEIIIIQDADLEYSPKDYFKLVDPIIKKESQVVYGSRVLPGGIRIRPKKIDTKIRIIANAFLTLLSNLLNNQNLTDCHTCYKVFLAELIKKIPLKENGFAFCPEVTAKISKLGVKIKEVPIDYFGRSHNDGKKINFIDGLRAIYAIFKYNF